MGDMELLGEGHRLRIDMFILKNPQQKSESEHLDFCSTHYFFFLHCKFLSAQKMSDACEQDSRNPIDLHWRRIDLGFDVDVGMEHTHKDNFLAKCLHICDHSA